MKRYRSLLFSILLLIIFSTISFASGNSTIMVLANIQWLSTLLLISGFLFLLISIFVPGIGVPEVLCTLSFGVYFALKITSGEGSVGGFILLVLGIVLLVIELFIPGFGIVGISGIVSLIIGIFYSSRSMEEAIVNILLLLLISVVFIIYMFKYGFKSKRFDNIKLKNTINTFRQSEEDEIVLDIGDEGKTITNLKPTGFIEIKGNRFDATAESNWIEKDRRVKIIEIIGRKIVVKEEV